MGVWPYQSITGKKEGRERRGPSDSFHLLLVPAMHWEP